MHAFYSFLTSASRTAVVLTAGILLLLLGQSATATVHAATSDRAENNGFTAVFHADRTISVEGVAPTHANGVIELQFDSAPPQSTMLFKQQVAVDENGYFHYLSPAIQHDQISVFVATNLNVTYYLGLRYADTLTYESPGEGVTLLDDNDPRLKPAALDERKITEIRAKWQQYRPIFDYTQDLHKLAPQWQGTYRAGQLHDQVQQDALQVTRFARYLAGLSETVQLDPQLTSSAQHKTVVLQQTYNADDPHNPLQPRDMEAAFYQIAESWKNIGGSASENLHYGHTPASAVLSFMDDRGWKNQYNVGHRRAILQIGLQRVGFGMTKDYTLMHLNSDRNMAWPSNRDFIAWPAPGYFPTLLGDFEMFSITLNPERYTRIDRESLTVEVTDKRNRVHWLFYETANFSSEAGNLNLSSSQYGGHVSEMLTFGPRTTGEHTLNIQDGDEFLIRINGLQTTDGQPASIEYVTHFFEVDEQKQREAQQRKLEEEAKLAELAQQEQQIAQEQMQQAAEQQFLAAFRDVPGHWAETAIRWGIDAGYVAGYGDGTFKPNATVTEAEFLAFFLRPRVPLADWTSVYDQRWDDPLYAFANHHAFPAWGTSDPIRRGEPITRVRVAELIAHFDGQRDRGDAAIQYLLDRGYSSGKTAPTVAGYEGEAALTRAEALTFSYSLRDTLASFQTDQP